MKRISLISALLLAATACHSAPPPATAPAAAPSPMSSDVEVRRVVEEFGRALATGDSLRVLELLHPEVSVYEAGHAETKEEYRSGHLRSDIDFLQSVQQHTLREQLIPGREMSLYLREYHLSGTLRDRQIDSRGTETLVLVPTVDGWRIRHIHWSSAR